MNWQHEVFKEKSTDKAYGEWMFQIREVYYEDGKEVGQQQGPAQPTGASLEDLKWVLQKMLAACDGPVRTVEDSK